MKVSLSLLSFKLLELLRLRKSCRKFAPFVKGKAMRLHPGDYLRIEEIRKTAKWFWEEIVQDTSVFYDHSLGEKDVDGKEYQWEDEEALHKQVPAMNDFLFFVKEEACFRVEDPRSNALNNLEQMYQLADKWYGENG